MKYTDEQRVEKVLKYAKMLLQYVKDIDLTKEKLESDRIIQWTITTPLFHIGENAYNLSNEFKLKMPQVQWNLISGLRHRLVLDYDGTNWETVFTIIDVEIPELIKQLEEN